MLVTSKKATPASIISPFNMTIDKIKVALTVLSHRIEIACYKGYDKDVFIAAAIH